MNPSSGLIIIGNEILSGRTQDANIRFLAQKLGALGAPLREVRVIPDVHDTIIETVSTFRASYDQVFTTGGIGPTHDDITAQCVAEAFGVPLELHAESAALLEQHYGTDQFTPSRQRMAMLPRGATPIKNARSVAPGFSIGNVHVMAGVPAIMQSMFGALEPSLLRGQPVVSLTWHALNLFESMIAIPFSAIQDRFPDLDLGSYPFRQSDGERGVALVAKGADPERVKEAAQEVYAMIAATGATPVEGEPAKI